MRFNVNLILSDKEIPKDKNRMFLSFIKHSLSKNNERCFENLYGKGITNRKSFALASYLPGAIFNENTITIPNKKIKLTISVVDMKLGVEIFNSMMGSVNNTYKYKDCELTTKSVKLLREKKIENSTEIFKTLSPIVIRDHVREDNKDWFYDLNDSKGQELFVRNLKFQLEEEMPESKYFLEELEVEVLKNKKTVATNYGINVQCNLCVLKINAKSEILEHIYKSGVGSFKSQGFGLLDII
ncbi:CRISPR-associated endoribonuclease Cas6 [Finegoldia magna]|uniref:CRISPR-associated endoribonuclease Cas6 n=1 Tax=Finegoldia magna TaxID=1260 RepID=UPI000B9183C1|nr:CRISPR-associated endoribonuclease Cas6 [Finegoldia magna]OXZ29889.1 CRISPR-associated endoribonuclease Cas6 [Finegoldia magna]